MTRQKKYPDTSTFHFHNQNPKNRYTTDCVARAISRATGIEYQDVVRGLADEQIATGYDASDPKCFGRYLERLGWHKHKQPRKPDGTKYTGKEFCQEIMRYDCSIPGDFRIWEIVANIGGNHTVAIIHGQVNDTWDSTDGCVGNFWAKC